jgi:hypothetical protein
VEKPTLLVRKYVTFHGRADAGFTPVIDWVVPDRAQLDFFVELLAPRPVLFVVLAPGLEVCWERDATWDPRQRVDYDYSSLGVRMGQ